MIDFDTLFDHHKGSGLKWQRYAVEKDIIPMWLADMDFACPNTVVEAILKRCEYPFFAYGNIPTSLNTAFCEHIYQKSGWEINPSWLVWIPGVGPGLHLFCHAFVETSQTVMTSTPVYPLLFDAPKNMKSNVVTVPMKVASERMTLDFAAMEKSISTNTQAYLLCNPHNPGGTVYCAAELEKLIEFCQRHDLLLCSDEIHYELILDNKAKHIHVASINKEASSRTITFLSESKTFNLAGLNCAVAVIPNPTLRESFIKAREGLLPEINIMGYTATEAVLRGGSKWLAALLPYLKKNRDLLLTRINAISGLSMMLSQATYLAWIDCRETGLVDPAAFFLAAGVGVSNGDDFGSKGFVRLNFACPRSLLIEAIERIEDAFRKREK